MNVLFLTHRLPYAPNRGDRLRAFHIIRMLRSQGATVDVLSLVHDREEEAQVDRMREELGVDATAVHVPRLRNYATGALALAGTQPLTHVLLDTPEWAQALRGVLQRREPDVVLAYCSSMARFAMEAPLVDYPLVVDLVDVDSQKWAALAETASQPKRWIFEREVRYLSRFERVLAEHACTTVVVNEREARALRLLAPNATVHVVPVGVDLDALTPTCLPVDAPRLVFCGVMDYAPNIEGVLWFVRDVWPLIRARRPETEFTIVGSNPTPAIRRLASRDSGITVTGHVDAVQNHLWNAALSVVPLVTARGVQTKVLEAVAAGLPAVVTSSVHEGLPEEIFAACRVADTPAAFAGSVLELLTISGAERRAIAGRADVHNLDWDSQLAPLYTFLVDAAGTRNSDAHEPSFAPAAMP